jgi:hypothetical protein
VVENLSEAGLFEKESGLPGSGISGWNSAD